MRLTYYVVVAFLCAALSLQYSAWAQPDDKQRIEREAVRTLNGRGV
jgi:hypothetical protein